MFNKHKKTYLSIFTVLLLVLLLKLFLFLLVVFLSINIFLQVVSWISQFTTLLPGDIILTGDQEVP